MAKHVKPKADEFEVNQRGITHKPTGYAFVPFPGSPGRGTANEAMLGGVLPNGRDYRPNDVKQLAHRLWADYVSKQQL